MQELADRPHASALNPSLVASLLEVLGREMGICLLPCERTALMADRPTSTSDLSRQVLMHFGLGHMLDDPLRWRIEHVLDRGMSELLGGIDPRLLGHRLG